MERRSVMQELHDGTVQDLAGVQIKLGAIQKIVSRYGLSGIVDEVRSDLNLTIQNIRSMIFENSPHLLSEKGLVGAIQWLAKKISDQHGICVEFSSDSHVELLDSHHQTFIFCTIRELLINIVKHAKAEQASISIKKNHSSFLLMISDNGKGFKTDAIGSFTKKRHFGIYNIIERTKHYNGRIKIKSTPGKGTYTALELPIE
jgi:signal transduction histidine kinase